MPIVLGWELKTKELSKVRSKVAVVYTVPYLSGLITKAVLYIIYRNDLVIEMVQLLANPHLDLCLGMKNNELIWKRLTCNFFACTITVMVYQFLLQTT